MMLRRPAHAHRLLAARQAGRHPVGVQLVVSDKGWERSPGCAWPHLWLRPADWTPGVYDWTALAGLPVNLVGKIEQGTPLLEIGAEVSESAAWVWLVSLYETIEVRAFLMRLDTPDRAWPLWWSSERERRAQDNYRRWRAEILKLTTGRAVVQCAAL